MFSAPSCSRKRKQPDEEEQPTSLRPQQNDDDDNGELLDRRRLLDRYISRTKIQTEYDLVDDGEEDPEQNDNVLEELARAQETSTLKQYDGIKITPFNLEEEQEEGEYDKAGNFIFRRKKKDKNADDEEEEEEDNWAESIDWSAVEKEEQAKKERQHVEKLSSDVNMTVDKSSNLDDVKRSKVDCYKHMLRIVRPDETIQKTIRRLGNSIPKRQFVKKKSHNPDANNDTSSTANESGECKRKLDLMIELAHQLLEEGDTDIYQKTYEQLEDAIN